MISIEFALEIHALLIEEFGGQHGLRDKPGLEASLARPFASFGGKDLYDSPIKKAGALMESIIKNHPFIDGNKRIGYLLGRLFLLNNGLDIQANEKQKYEFVISIASGHSTFNQIDNCVIRARGLKQPTYAMIPGLLLLRLRNFILLTIGPAHTSSGRCMAFSDCSSSCS